MPGVSVVAPPIEGRWADVGVGGEEGLDLVEERLAVIGVLVLPELVALLAERAGLAVALLLHDEAGLLERLADKAVELAEPAPQRRVVLRVDVDLVDGVEDGLHRGAVGEALEQGAELGLGLLEGRVGPDVGTLVGAIAGDAFGVDLVRLEEAEEGLDGVLVVAVALLLHDDLFEAVDEPVAALLRELFIGVVLDVAADLAGALLVLLGDLVRCQLVLPPSG